jgi:hypothetical protein
VRWRGGSVEFDEKNNPVPLVSIENSTSVRGRIYMLSRFVVIIYLRRIQLVCPISLLLDCVIFHVHASYRCEFVNSCMFPHCSRIQLDERRTIKGEFTFNGTYRLIVCNVLSVRCTNSINIY